MKGILRPALTLIAFTSLAFTDMRPFVIYGDDDRMDLYQVTRPDILEVSTATAALIPASRMQENKADASYKVITGEYGSEMGLCEGEPYFNQPVAPFCSGFLVGEDLLVTAGHCIETIDDCRNTNFVFGFHMTDENTANNHFDQNQVYGCGEIVTRELTSHQDYALIRLDRKVQGIAPLKISRHTKMAEFDPIFVVGHPAGLPTKVAAGALVRSWSDDGTFFTANLDTYGGNSGSAVFNAQTLEVEGILVRGEQDFIFDNSQNCRRSNHCNVDTCRGEDVTNIKLLNNFIPEI